MLDGRLLWNNPQFNVEASTYEGDPHHRSLGKVDVARFDSRCGLCVAIFSILPGPQSPKQEIHLLAESSIHRLERLVNVQSHQSHKFDTCIIADLLYPGEDFEIDEHEGDALAIMRDSNESLACGGVVVQRDRIDIPKLQSFVAVCQQKHKLSCIPRNSTSLRDIRLIDTATRELVRYPDSGCDYFVLSYVWGAVHTPQPDTNGVLPPLPATIEDAIILTNLWGRRYLWVDRVCINQENEAEKEYQISLMADIYRGAYVTIVALCGSSAEYDLTRVSNSAHAQPQLSCTVDGTALIGLMPTLSRQIAYQKWGTRAWTLQEALLSPRTMYITDHQAYFECNAMQCCESVNTSQSWIHNSTRDAPTILNNPGGTVLGHGTLRNAVVGLAKPEDPMMAYGTLAALYSYREMSFPEDAINAFSAILQHLEEWAFKNGFCWGLHEDDFNWSLMWCGLYNLTRRDGFPAWSWAGWQGPIHPGWPNNPQGDTQQYWTHLYVWAFDGPKIRRVYPHYDPETLPLRLFAEKTLLDVKLDSHVDPMFEKCPIAAAKSPGHHILDCFVCSRSFDHGRRDTSWDWGPFEHYVVRLNGVDCLLRRPRTLRNPPRASQMSRSALYILVGRDKAHGMAVHHFLDVDMADDGSATKRSVMYLLIPLSEPQALDDVLMERRYVVLV